MSKEIIIRLCCIAPVIIGLIVFFYAWALCITGKWADDVMRRLNERERDGL